MICVVCVCLTTPFAQPQCQGAMPSDHPHPKDSSQALHSSNLTMPWEWEWMCNTSHARKPNPSSPHAASLKLAHQTRRPKPRIPCPGTSQQRWALACKSWKSGKRKQHQSRIQASIRVANFQALTQLMKWKKEKQQHGWPKSRRQTTNP